MTHTEELKVRANLFITDAIRSGVELGNGTGSVRIRNLEYANFAALEKTMIEYLKRLFRKDHVESAHPVDNGVQLIHVDPYNDRFKWTIDPSLTVEVRRQRIMDVVNQTTNDLLFKERLKDNKLTRGEIEEAILEGEVSIEDIMLQIRNKLEESVKQHQEKKYADDQDS